MANDIIGLDFGAYAIKVVRIQRSREPRVVAHDHEQLSRPTARPPEGDNEQGPDPTDFDDAPTAVMDREDLAGANDDVPRDQRGLKADEGDEFAAGPPTKPAPPGDTGDADTGAPETAMPPWEAALGRLIERGAFDEAGLVVTFLPNGEAMSIRQHVPFGERDKVENVLPHMLEDRLPVDPVDVVYDFQLIDSTVEQGAEAVVGFARKQRVGAFLDELKPHHIDPAVLGIPELLLTYALNRCAPTRQGTFATVDVGHEFTRVLVLHHGEPVVARSVQFGGRRLTEALAEQFDAAYDQAEQLKITRAALVGPHEKVGDHQRRVSDCLQGAFRPFVRDLRRTFQSLYANSRIEIDEVFICGGTSKLDGLADHLSLQFGVSVAAFPLGRIPGMTPPSAEGFVDGAPAEADLTLAASAALQQLDGLDDEQLIDLRKDEFTYRGKASYLRGQMLKYGAAMAVLIVLVGGMLYTQMLQMQARRDAMHEAVNQQSAKLFGEPISSKEAVKKRLAGESSSHRGYIPKMSAYQLYYELSSRVSDDLDVTLDEFEVDANRNLAQISGETTGPQAVDQLMDDFRSLECLKEVRQAGSLDTTSDSKVDFNLHISSGCS